jgi:hypothetical protein
MAYLMQHPCQFFYDQQQDPCNTMQNLYLSFKNRQVLKNENFLFPLIRKFAIALNLRMLQMGGCYSFLLRNKKRAAKPSLAAPPDCQLRFIWRAPW